jgi:protein-disulfide isomerase
VRGTPSFFVNGRPFARATSDDFKALVDSLSKKPK